MPRPMIRIHNSETDEIVDREMTVAEFKQYESEQAALAAKAIEAENIAQTKAALLTRLGITADEAALLLS